MDWGVTEGTATVVAFSDGSASVYLSSGGGFIGGSSHESIRKAAQNMVTIAADFQPSAIATTTYPLPRHAQVIFYFLTDAGIFTANAPQEELSSHRHPLSKLGDAAQNVITQYRLIKKWNEEVKLENSSLEDRRTETLGALSPDGRLGDLISINNASMLIWARRQAMLHHAYLLMILKRRERWHLASSPQKQPMLTGVLSTTLATNSTACLPTEEDKSSRS